MKSAAKRWEIDVSWFVGLAFGVTWAFGSLFVNLGPCQVVIGRS